MTTRTIVFDSPLLLGFEHTRALVERASKAATDSYPPYNVEQLGEGRVRITLAVAGFAPEHLSVAVEGGQLVINGRREAEARADAPGGAVTLHRGIAGRSFLRTFVLADGMEVDGAELQHGLLHIDVVRPEPSPVVKRIAIRTAG